MKFDHSSTTEEFLIDDELSSEIMPETKNAVSETNLDLDTKMAAFFSNSAIRTLHAEQIVKATSAVAPHLPLSNISTSTNSVYNVAVTLTLILGH